MREPFFQMFWNRLSAVGKQNSALCECPRLLHQLRPLEELLCCAEHFLTALNIFLLRWIWLLLWTCFYSAERFLCAEHFYAVLIFSVLSICCCDENLCCIEHSHVVLNIFSCCTWAYFSSASAAPLQKNSANLSASSGKWCVMSHLSFKLASTATTTHNVENWINGLLKVVRGALKLKPARSSLLVVELLKPLQSDNACSQSSTNRQSCSRRTPAELQGVFWSCKGVFHI